MSSLYEKAKAGFKTLANLPPNELLTRSTFELLHHCTNALIEDNQTKSKETVQKWCNETELLRFPEVFIQIVTAEHFVRYDVENVLNKQDYSQSVLRNAIHVLLNATCLATQFSKALHEKNVVVHILYTLNRQFRDNVPNEVPLKHLDYTDAHRCVVALTNAMNRERQVGELLQRDFSKAILTRLFTCKQMDTAYKAVALLARITTDKSGKELVVPEQVLSYSFDNLVQTLNGKDTSENDVHIYANTFLFDLNQLVSSSDDFNQRVMQYKHASAFSLLDILADVLEAPQPPNDANNLVYRHEVGTNGNKAAYSRQLLKTTHIEKKHSAKLCWTLLLSERCKEQNCDAMRKHGRIVTALKTASSCADKEVSENAKGALWDFVRHDPVLQAAANVGAQKPNATDQPKLLSKRPTSRTNSASKQVVPQTEKQNANKKPMVMISYASKFKPELVLRINSSLQKAGIDTWIYNEKLDGDIFDAMGKAVEQSAVVLVCYSSPYADSHPCHQEVNYARVCSKPMVFVRLENFTPVGWLGISVAGINYHDFSAKEDDTEAIYNARYNARFEKLTEELRKLM